MINSMKTNNNFSTKVYSLQKAKKAQYISRSTNKKVSLDKNSNKSKINHNKNNTFKISSTLMNMNHIKNKNNRYKNTSEFSQNNSLYNLIANKKNVNKSNHKNNIKIVSIPKNKILFNDYKGNNSSIIFSVNDNNKVKNNSLMSSHKPNNKKDGSNFEKKYKFKNSYQNNAINHQKESNKKNYDNNQKHLWKYINSNNNSKEESITDNKNIHNVNKNYNENNLYSNINNDLILDSNNNYITYQKNKNTFNNNKYILQKILTNLFSSNKKKNNLLKNDFKIMNNNHVDKEYVNDSFHNNNNNKMTYLNNNNNNFSNCNENMPKRRITPKLNSNNYTTKKISGLFSADPKGKVSNMVTDICNSKSKKMNDNLVKRNLSINVHSYNIQEGKFKTSINFDIMNKKIENDMPKLNLYQVFNLKLYDKVKDNENNSNYCKNINISINNDKHIKEDDKKILYLIHKNNGSDNSKKKSNTPISNMVQNSKDGKENNTNNIHINKFSPKNIYTKDLNNSQVQRFFSYSKDKNDMKPNINFVNNIIKIINFNEYKGRDSKNSDRRSVKSNDSKGKQSRRDVRQVNKVNKKNGKNNSFNKFKYGKEIINDKYINLRKKRTKYSDINKIIEINNLRCLKYINNSELNNNINLKKLRNNCDTNETMNKNNSQKRNNSASHNNVNSNNGKYDISRIGNIFKPIIEHNMKGSFKGQNHKTPINFEFFGNKGKKDINIYNKSKNNEYYKNIINKNRHTGIYDSSKKETNFNTNLSNRLKIEEIINFEIDESKTKENIFRNSLTMYSIYIISKFYDICDKIGIAKIGLYDLNQNLIPIEYSNTSEDQNVNYVFDSNHKSSFSGEIQQIQKNNNPLIAQLKSNFCINFYIKNYFTPSLEYIYINNFSDINNGISPVKEIKIFKTNILLYKGLLDINNPNIITLSKIAETNNKNLIKSKEANLTFTIFKSLIKDNSDTNITDNNNRDSFKINKYNSARNTFHSRYSDENYKEGNVLVKSHNVYENENYIESFLGNYDGNNKNEYNENLLFFQSGYDNTNNFSSTFKNFSNANTSNINCLSSGEFIPNEDNHFSKTLKYPNYSNQIFLNSYNSAFDDCDNLFRTSIGYQNKDDCISKYNNYNNNFTNNFQDYNYVEFNKISIYLKSNYGHRKYIGLTGIIFISNEQKPIDIEKAKAIGALPKDLRTIYNDDNDNRIFENVFNGMNNTNDSDNMWVTRYKKNEYSPYIELYFEEKIKLSKIIIYNYNEKNKLDIGTKVIDIYLDNYFYKSINLIQGTGETSNEQNNDFGQEINCFNDFKYNETKTINNFNCINNSKNNETSNDIPYASNFCEQCYETPYLPSGYVIKFQFFSFFFNKNEKNNLKQDDFYIGFENIEIFNELGINILEKNNNSNKYKMISNRTIKSDGKILLKGVYGEDDNQNKFFDNENNLFYVFDKYNQISYIKFTPFANNKNNNENNLYKIKEIKIFCDENIIFEGNLYNNKPTIILFTSDKQGNSITSKNKIFKLLNNEL